MTDKLDGFSMDIAAAEQDKLRTVFPQCFVEGKLDVDKLLSLCGEFETVDENDREKYEFRWKGKQEALQLAGKRSAGTLRPCPEESVDWESTRNLYIEGDNLEVLKLLQTSYYRKVKMIYIDPPYNTGNDFVYTDDFSDPLARYKEVTQQTTKSNPETMGRFHTNWLNMMYPRLRLAANLLQDDGVIFISIDDNEVHNLRKLCDEVFGEENFVAQITVQSNPRGRQSDTLVASVHDYLLVYGKLLWECTINGAPLSAEQKGEFALSDENGNYRLLGLRQRGSASRREDRPDMYFPIYVNPQNGAVSLMKEVGFATVLPKKSDGTDGRWMWGKEKCQADIARLVSKLIERRGEYDIFVKDYLDRGEGERTRKYKTIWDYKEYNNQFGTQEVKSLVGDAFSFPKSSRFLLDIVRMGSNSNDNDIILDFFSGSATTAHAVMQLNVEDGGNRRFILVQLPEVCDENSEAAKAGFKNICEIGKERIRRAGAKIQTENEKLKSVPLLETEDEMNLFVTAAHTKGSKGVEAVKPLFKQADISENTDTGFRVFKLDSSNLKLWDDSPITGDNAVETFEQRLLGMLEILKPDRSDVDVVYEVMLKLGQDLCEPICAIELEDNRQVYGFGADVKFIVCLAQNITPEDAAVMAEYAPSRIIFADQCFNNSTDKSNVKLTLRDKGITIKVL